MKRLDFSGRSTNELKNMMLMYNADISSPNNKLQVGIPGTPSNRVYYAILAMELPAMQDLIMKASRLDYSFNGASVNPMFFGFCYFVNNGLNMAGVKFDRNGGAPRIQNGTAHIGLEGSNTLSVTTSGPAFTTGGKVAVELDLVPPVEPLSSLRGWKAGGESWLNGASLGDWVTTLSTQTNINNVYPIIALEYRGANDPDFIELRSLELSKGEELFKQ